MGLSHLRWNISTKPQCRVREHLTNKPIFACVARSPMPPNSDESRVAKNAICAPTHVTRFRSCQVHPIQWHRILGTYSRHKDSNLLTGRSFKPNAEVTSQNLPARKWCVGREKGENFCHVPILAPSISQVLLRNAFLFRQSLRILPETKGPLLSMQSGRIILPYNSSWLSLCYMLVLSAGTETPDDDHYI
jgi:hypothetical protein